MDSQSRVILDGLPVSNDSTAAGIVIRINDHRAIDARLKDAMQNHSGPLEFHRLVHFRRMEHHQGETSRLKPGFACLSINPINSRRPHAMHASRIFPQPHDSPRTLLRGGEMNMSQLGDRMSQGIVHLPQSPIPAVHMRHRQSQNMSRRRGREGLDAIPDYENHVWAQLLKISRQPRYRVSSGFGPGTAFPRKDRIDFPTRLANASNAPPMPAIEMHPRNDDLQFQLFRFLNREQNRTHEPEFSPGPGDEANSPLVAPAIARTVYHGHTRYCHPT